jgi:hypothetical protein
LEAWKDQYCDSVRHGRKSGQSVIAAITIGRDDAAVKSGEEALDLPMMGRSTLTGIPMTPDPETQ